MTAASALDADLSAVPISTYRLQLHQGFRFADAEALVPYLAALGVGACYSSPHLMARPGSTHGYDICDHSRLNPEVGGEEEYAGFVGALRRHQLGHIVDFVPNHMGIDASANPWWRDVLENGPSSPFAAYFDIDWHPVKDELEQKLLLPILGDQYGRVLERGELQVHFSAGAFVLRYFEHDLPLNPRKTTQILEHGLDALRRDLGDEDPHLLELLSVITALRNLPAYTATSPGSIAERQREKEVARERLARLAAAAPAIRAHIESAVGAVNGTPGDAASFDALHQVLESQAYRLAYWRTASHEINYRRFFDINQLAGLRMEDERVFEDTHRLLLRLVADGAANAARRRKWPFAMLATSTHDTKRGEDGRARLDVLSEIPEEWGRHLSLWARLNASHRAVVGGEPAPARDDEYLFYQTLLAAWPQDTDEADAALVERVREYMVKAAREAKLRTSWISENRAYEAGLGRFVDRVLAAPARARCRAAFAPFRRRVARLGMLNSLSQLVLKIASPGVPDFYQGTELWDLSLVDPDNRRPVDFARRRSTLAAPSRGSVSARRLPSTRSPWPSRRERRRLRPTARRERDHRHRAAVGHVAVRRRRAAARARRLGGHRHRSSRRRAAGAVPLCPQRTDGRLGPRNRRDPALSPRGPARDRVRRATLISSPPPLSVASDQRRDPQGAGGRVHESDPSDQ